MIKPTTVALIVALSANGAGAGGHSESPPNTAAALMAIIVGFALFIICILYLERNDR